jgi:hypothetical protein
MKAKKFSEDSIAESRASLWTSVLSLFTSSGTLVCYALPALLVAIGAGAALSLLVSVFAQVVWLSEHKVGLFVFAAWQWAGAAGCSGAIGRPPAPPIPPCAMPA